MLTNQRKGIILAGGTGSRLYPLTAGISKQLMPVYDKPMIYYPISTLMLANIKEILIITTREDKNSFERLLGDGNEWGMNFDYAIQDAPNGIAEAFLIASDFLDKSPCALILGDNLFHGSDFGKMLTNANQNEHATIFLYPVNDPHRYGIVEFDINKNISSIVEKPTKPKSNYAVTGLYFYDEKVVEYAKKITPSARGELEITSINQIYLESKKLKTQLIGRGSAWLDTGTFDSLSEAGLYIQTLEKRQGLKIGCPEEIAWRKNWISNNDLRTLASRIKRNSYCEYLNKLVH